MHTHIITHTQLYAAARAIHTCSTQRRDKFNTLDKSRTHSRDRRATTITLFLALFHFSYLFFSVFLVYIFIHASTRSLLVDFVFKTIRSLVLIYFRCPLCESPQLQRSRSRILNRCDWIFARRSRYRSRSSCMIGRINRRDRYRCIYGCACIN